MGIMDPKLCRHLSLIALGKCPFPTKTNEIHVASRSSVGSQKQLILSCLDLVIAEFGRTRCAPVGDLHSRLGQFVESRLNGKKQTILYRLHNIRYSNSVELLADHLRIYAK